MATKPEIIKALSVLAAAYPKFELTDATVEIYCRLLADLDFDTLKAATLHCATINTFFPAVAEIRSAAVELLTMAEGVPTEAEAWKNVLDEVRRVGSYGAPQFKHPLVDQTVRQIGWLNICMSENMVSDRARFMDIYQKSMRDTNLRNRMLPEVRDLVENKLITGNPMKQLAMKMENA